MEKWVSVKERLPSLDDEGKDFLASYQGLVGIARWHGAPRKWGSMPVDYWMPLPDPPEPELKPCPFCGGMPVIVNSDGNFGLWTIACWKCRSQTRRLNHKEQAIHHWNSRIGDCQ